RLKGPSRAGCRRSISTPRFGWRTAARWNESWLRLSRVRDHEADGPVVDAVRAVVEHKMEVFGSAGKAVRSRDGGSTGRRRRGLATASPLGLRRTASRFIEANTKAHAARTHALSGP